MKTGTLYPLLAALAVAGAAHANVTLYKQANFTGAKVTLREDTTNLSGTALYDAASSIVVHDNAWEFCTSPQFRGDCVTLPKGRYSKLDKRLNHRIESAREVVADNRGDRGWRDDGRRDDSRRGDDYPRDRR